MFREDSQIDFAKENVILNVSLRPSLLSACTFHFKTDSQLCVNYMYLLKIPSKIKPRPVGLCYTNCVYRRTWTWLWWFETKLLSFTNQ